MFRRCRYELRPNRQQRQKLAATLDLCRNLSNGALKQRKIERLYEHA